MSRRAAPLPRRRPRADASAGGPATSAAPATGQAQAARTGLRDAAIDPPVDAGPRLTAAGLAGATGVTRYHQLASLLRHDITSGTWPPGHRLPTVERLAQDVGVARITVRQAYAQLASEGLITTERGRGTHVAATPAGPSPGLHAAINDPIRHPDGLEITLLGSARGQSLPAELCVNDTAASAPYVRLDKIHRHAGEPFCLIQLYVREREFDGFPAQAAHTAKIARLLLEHSTTVLGELHQSMTVGPADVAQVKALDYVFAAPVARVVRRMTDAAGQVVYAGIFWYRGDRFVLDVTLPAELMYRYPKAVVPAARP